MFREQCVKFAEMDTREQLHEAFFLSARSAKLWVNKVLWNWRVSADLWYIIWISAAAATVCQQCPGEVTISVFFFFFLSQALNK